MATKKIISDQAAEKEPASSKRINSFAPKKFEQHTLVDSDGKVVGHVRVKPNGILWSPKGGKDWYGVPLTEFANFLQKAGKKQSK
jgi:hypothetical protein